MSKVDDDTVIEEPVGDEPVVHVDEAKLEGEEKTEGKVSKRKPFFHVDFHDDTWGEKPYEVQVEQQRNGFVFQGNIAITVNVNGPLGGILKPMSKIIKINDTTITYENFGDLYNTTPRPFTMTCLPPTGKTASKGSTGTTVTTLAKADLISLMVIYAAVFIDFLASMIVVPMLPFLADELGADSTQLSYLFSAYSVGSIVGGLMIGQISGKLGTKYAIMYSMFGSCVVFLWCSFAGSYVSLLAARFVGGLSGNSVPACIIFIGLRVPQDLKAKYMSYNGIIITTALMLGPLAGGALSRYGLNIPFLFGSGVAGLGLIATFFGMSNHTPPIKPEGVTVTTTTENKIGYVLSLVFVVPFTALVAMLGQWLILRFNVDQQDLGNIVSLHGIIVASISILIFPAAIKRMGLYGTWACGCVISIVGMVTSSFMPSWWSFFIIMSPLAGGGYSFMSNTNNPLADFWTTPYSKAKVMSVNGAFNSVGFAVGPIFWGIWLDYCDRNDMLEMFWVLPGAAYAIPGVVMLCAYCCVYKKSLEAKKHEDERKKNRENEHRNTLEVQTEATDEDYLKLGRLIGEGLSKKQWDWQKSPEFLAESILSHYPLLPVRAIEPRMKAIWWAVAQGTRSKHVWEQYALDNDLIDVPDGDKDPLLPSHQHVHQH